jgi:predicted enzyme related to lactoylglutathione lyase
MATQDLFKDTGAFSSYSVNDVDAARTFYGETLGLQVTEIPEMDGLLDVRVPGGASVMLYAKPDHAPATFTVLNFLAAGSIEDTVAELTQRGVPFEVYNQGPVQTDERGIASGPGPRIAWFRDPAGNILSILEMD